MTYDSDTFRRRASALHGDEGSDAEVAGHLALAYAAIERRRAARGAEPAAEPELEEKPILLQD
ncbi:MAG TPA: hypothetical protein VFK50_01865 [Sphingomicrobium sp.]|nr:hypothetical protein [Sphingomicrobium sp.]